MKLSWSRGELRSALREHDLAPSAGCQTEERMLAFYAGGLSEAEDGKVREHLVACPSCLELARDARRFAAAMTGGGESEPAFSRERRAWVAPLALAAGVTLLAVGLRLVSRGGGPSPSPAPSPRPSNVVAGPIQGPSRELPIPKAGYSAPIAPDDGLVFRDEGGAAPVTSAFDRAMEAYLRDDFGQAERLLRDCLARDPRNARARFYRAVSLLLLGRTSEAMPLLEPAAESPGPLRDEARFYLALAYLRLGQPESARPRLEALAASAGAHRAEARALLERFGAGPPAR